MNKSLLLTLALSSLSVPALAASTGVQSDFDTLFQQADFWQSKQRQDLAKDALNRILAADPNNTEALYRLAMIAIQEGDNTHASAYIERLKTVAPNDAHLEELRIAQASTDVDSGALGEARVLAASGQAEEAIARYKSLFSGDTPPASLALEYYQTLAGTQNGWDAARQGLAKLHQAQPGNSAVAIAYGQVLTYRDSTRRQGINLLAKYDAVSKDATKAWRQGLLWLDADKADQPLYQAFEQAHPGDKQVADYYHDKTTLSPTQAADQARSLGYKALDAGRLGEAEKAFRQALATKSQDPQALAGLGLVELRRQRFASARDNLAQAIRLAPAQKSQWQKAYESADFYARLGQARSASEHRQYDTALNLLAPLTGAGGSQGHDAQLLKADVLQKKGELDSAEASYRALLAKRGTDNAARLGLVNVLRQQQRWSEASEVAQALPASAKGELGDLASGQAMVLRDRAASESPVMAEATLRQASVLAPKNPWVRLDLARLLNKTGRPLAAQVLVNRGVQDYGLADDRYVAALLAKDQQRWGDVARLLEPVSASKRSAEIKDLLESAALQARLDEIKRRQQVGDREGARQLIMDMYNKPPQSAAGVGEVASMLYESGEPAMALMLIRQNDQKALTSPVAQYQTQVLVMIKAGADQEADALVARLSQRRDLGPGDWAAIEQIRNAMAVAKADKLRLADQLAEAYDVLAARLRVAPNDEPLLLAMARLYQTGNKNSKALQIYQYTLKHNPGSLDALSGAVEVAITTKDLDVADQLLAQLSRDQAEEPAMLLLAAKVARARGDNDQALRLLAKSRSKLFEGQQDQPWLVASDSQPGFDNPFAANKAPAKGKAGDNPWRRPSWLPGGDDLSTEQSPWKAQDTPAGPPSLVAQIDSLTREIHKDSATRLDANVEFRSRNGQAGLGQLDEVKTPVTIETQLGSGRLKAQITPTYLNGGTLSGDYSRFGSGALGSAASTLSQDLNDMPDVLDGIEDTAYSYEQARLSAESAQAIYQAALADKTLTAIQQAQFLATANQAELTATQAKRNFDRAVQQDLLKGIGLNTDNLTSEDWATLNSYFGQLGFDSTGGLSSTSLEAFLDSRDAFESLLGSLRAQLNSLMRSAEDLPAQHDAGVALSLAYGVGDFNFDIGTTPLGFEEVNLVGGVQWQPQLDDNLRLDLNLERRAVTDSVLSYAGTYDPSTGTSWGAVTKNGLGVGLGYDDGNLGLYANLGGYRYLGHNVYNNTAFDLSLGGYLRPIDTKTRQLQTGIHVSFQSFDKNMSNFGLGHGGYFSPQDYVAVSFPITFSEQRNRFSYSVKLAPGFQSFTEKAVDFFPDDPEIQQLLDVFANLGLIDASQYQANSQSGFGLSIGAEGKYELSPNFTLGGKLGFDNFGEYSETSGQLYLHYLMGGSND